MRTFIKEYVKPKLTQSNNASKFTNSYTSSLNYRRKNPCSVFENLLVKNNIEHHLIKVVRAAT